MVTLALLFFGSDLTSEPHFVDESAYISQSFYADLWLDGRGDDPAWLAYAGYDLPPLPKYMIGLSLRVGGYRRPPQSAMWEWYANTSRRFVANQALTVARIPSVLLGALGCLAIYALGTLSGGRRVGALAALLLMLNPLYRMHARRAMSDVPAEALILATLAVGLWSWSRLLKGKGTVGPALGLALGSGVLCGLATLSKLNGSLGGFVLMSWAAMAGLLGTFPRKSRLGIILATVLAGGVAFSTFAAFNPFLTCHPKGPVGPNLEPLARATFLERVGVVYRHRSEVSILAKGQFPNDALTTPLEKVQAVVVQGFGRFGPFGPRSGTDSTVRYSRDQDRGAALWLPIVIIGAMAATIRGRDQLRQGEPPAAWAILAQSAVALGVVTAFIPLAWDRYFLSIQPGSALLGAFAADQLVRVLAGMPRTEPVP